MVRSFCAQDNNCTTRSMFIQCLGVLEKSHKRRVYSDLAEINYQYCSPRRFRRTLTDSIITAMLSRISSFEMISSCHYCLPWPLKSFDHQSSLLRREFQHFSEGDEKAHSFVAQVLSTCISGHKPGNDGCKRWKIFVFDLLLLTELRQPTA